MGVKEGYSVKGTKETRKSRQRSSNIVATNFFEATVLQCLTSRDKYRIVNFDLCGKTAASTGVCYSLAASFHHFISAHTQFKALLSQDFTFVPCCVIENCPYLSRAALLFPTTTSAVPDEFLGGFIPPAHHAWAVGKHLPATLPISAWLCTGHLSHRWSASDALERRTPAAVTSQRTAHP